MYIFPQLKAYKEPFERKLATSFKGQSFCESILSFTDCLEVLPTPKKNLNNKVIIQYNVIQFLLLTVI